MFRTSLSSFSSDLADLAEVHQKHISTMAALAMNDDENVWIAASDGDIPKVQAYLVQDPSLATKGDHNGYTCMHAAAGKKHLPETH